MERCPMERPRWDQRYPDRRVLREEVDCMVQAIAEALLEGVRDSEIVGIYFKGSAQKEWDSPLDYVPELSDVDVHVLFADDGLVDRYVGAVEQAVAVQQSMERKYRSLCPHPVHVPRPQVTVLNRLLADADFCWSLPETVTVVRGQPYPAPPPESGDRERIRAIDCKRLLEAEQYVKSWPLRVVDKPDRYLASALWGLTWQVSPVGPRVAHLLDVSTEEAWGSNRTHIAALLDALGQDGFVAAYTQFYLSGWEYFLSGFADTDAGRQAFRSGLSAIERGIEIARRWRTEHSTDEVGK